MCLFIDPDRHPQKIPHAVILDQPLAVYKRLVATETYSNGAYVFESLVYCHRYVYGETYRLGKQLRPHKATLARELWLVDKGFHAFVNRPYLDNRHVDVLEFTIPAGSRVFYGQDGDIVATQITRTGKSPEK